MGGCRRTYGSDHPNTLRSLINVGALLRDLGKLKEAEPFLREAWEGRKRVFGEDNPETQVAQEVLNELLERLPATGE